MIYHHITKYSALTFYSLVVSLATFYSLVVSLATFYSLVVSLATFKHHHVFAEK
jgi:hypothetical protein